MVVCGIETHGREARLVILSGNRATFEVMPNIPSKLTVDPDDQISIRSFIGTLNTLLSEARVEKVGLNKQASSGKFVGVALKLEAWVQSCEKPIELVHHATTRATMKHLAPERPAALFAYQDKGFDIAYTLLPKED